MRIGAYILKQKLAGRKRYPLVLMLEPLFRCNLACTGCGKIDYPDAILNRRLSVKECLEAADECGAPMVAIPAASRSSTRRSARSSEAWWRARNTSRSVPTRSSWRRSSICSSPPSSCSSRCISMASRSTTTSRCAWKAASSARCRPSRRQGQGLHRQRQCHIFDGHPAKDIAAFLDLTQELGVGVTISPGYAYERAPDQDHFLNRRNTKELFRKVFAYGKGKNWKFLHSALFLDFLAGNQTYHCTPWGMPTRNIFGWQKPCYLLGEGYTKTFTELMETTDWDSYGTGAYEKCANCMAHCGYEATAAEAMFTRP